MADIRTHKGDLSDKAMARYMGDIAIDTETLGLVPRRDRLCVVQLSPGDGRSASCSTTAVSILPCSTMPSA